MSHCVCTLHTDCKSGILSYAVLYVTVHRLPPDKEDRGRWIRGDLRGGGPADADQRGAEGGVGPAAQTGAEDGGGGAEEAAG